MTVEEKHSTSEGKAHPMKDKPKTRDAELCRLQSTGFIPEAVAGSQRYCGVVQVSSGAVLQWEAVDGVVVHGVAIHGHQALPSVGQRQVGQQLWFPCTDPSSALIGGHTGRCRAEGEAEHCGQ